MEKKGPPVEIHGPDDAIGSHPVRALGFGGSGTGKTMGACMATVDRDLDWTQVWEELAEARRLFDAGEADTLAAAVDLRREAGAVLPQGDPTTFALLTEDNGVGIARAVNPKIGWAVCTRLNQSQHVLKMAASGELAALGYKRLVIDGITELQRQIFDEMYPDGMPADPDWMGMNDRTRRMLRFIRSLPLDVYATALEQSRENEEEKRVHVQPALEGRKLPAEAMQYFDAVGRYGKVERVTQGGATVTDHYASFSLPSRFKVKSCRGLTGTMSPCMAAWGEVLAGRLTPAEIRYQGRARTADTEAEDKAAKGGKKGLAY